MRTLATDHTPEAALICCGAGTSVRSAEHWMPSMVRNTVDEMETALGYYLSGVKRFQR